MLFSGFSTFRKNASSMLPTIDISLIGILLAIWNVFKVIWDYTSKAFNWIMQRALALYLGSKFWATTFFLAAFATCMVLQSLLISSILSLLGTFVVGSISVDSVRQSLIYAATIFPVDILVDVASFFVSGLISVVIAENYAMWWIRILGVFHGLTRAFKT